jgi:hypothetical protein
MTENVKLKALDSFHSSPTGTVPARGEFSTHRAHADELIAKGLAVELVSDGVLVAPPPRAIRRARDPQNKKAPDPQNNKDS